MKNNWQNEIFRNESELGWLKYSLEKRETEYSPSSVIGGNYKPFIDEYKNKSVTVNPFKRHHLPLQQHRINIHLTLQHSKAQHNQGEVVEKN